VARCIRSPAFLFLAILRATEILIQSEFEASAALASAAFKNRYQFVIRDAAATAGVVFSV
jgi:hypothetical protein